MLVLFSSLEFLFRFLPIFLLLYYFVPAKHKNTVLLLGSLVFYTIGEPFYVLLLMGSVGINYILAKKMSSFSTKQRWKQRKRKDWLVIALLVDAGLLGAFKLTSIALGSAILPLGLSFYTFKMISFQIDLYRKEIRELPDLKKLAVYLVMFPQVVSGPIMRYHEADFDDQARSVSPEKLEEGLSYFVLGLAGKVLLADRLAILWKELSTIGYESISTPLAWFGAAGYSLQLYFDFWGYSLMAAGLCVMLGFPFVENFRHPYASRSISEFWRRWHMTLGSFFRDYIYIPLGGSREGIGITICNLFIVWVLTGVWHGGSLNFILWGLILFGLIVLERAALGKVFAKVPAIGHLFVIIVIPITWIVFAVTDLGQLLIYFGRMFPFLGGSGIAVNHADIWKYLSMFGGYFLVGIGCCIPAVYRFFEKHRKNPLMIMLLFVLFWLSVYQVTVAQNNPFMYLKF